MTILRSMSSTCRSLIFGLVDLVLLVTPSIFGAGADGGASLLRVNFPAGLVIGLFDCSGMIIGVFSINNDLV